MTQFNKMIGLILLNPMHSFILIMFIKPNFMLLKLISTVETLDKFCRKFSLKDPKRY